MMRRTAFGTSALSAKWHSSQEPILCHRGCQENEVPLLADTALITKAMLSSGEKNAEATLLSLMWQSVSQWHLPIVSTLCQISQKFLASSCPAVSFELQVDDKASSGSVRPWTLQSLLAFIIKVPPHLCQIPGQSRASAHCFCITPLEKFEKLWELITGSWRSSLLAILN